MERINTNNTELGIATVGVLRKYNQLSTIILVSNKTNEKNDNFNN